jgi:hypothetical protein
MHDLATIVRMNNATLRGKFKLPKAEPLPTPESAAGQARAAGLRVKQAREGVTVEKRLKFVAFEIQPVIDWGDETIAYSSESAAHDARVHSGRGWRPIWWGLYGRDEEWLAHNIGDWTNLERAEEIAHAIIGDRPLPLTIFR